MNTHEQRAVLNIMIQAALADGRKSEEERAAIRDAAESLVTADGVTLAGVYQDVLLKRVTLETAAAALPQLEHRQLAYEMAVCVIDADGLQSEGEKVFLTALRQRLGLDGDETAKAAASRADAIAAAAYTPDTVLPISTNDPALDKRILNYAILNGALELLPQSWASMAIIPLQVRMVYRIGQSYGVNLDQGHIKEFLATLGVGLTSQYVEQIGRKLVGGLLGKAAVGMIGGLGRAATGMAFSFATTYALGHLAKRYYAGGRVMSTALLRSTYQDLLAQAKGTQQQYLPAIRDRASKLTPNEVMRLVKE
ncbi:MAG: YcjF family protein [Gammaproteobacteria bacterium]